MKNLFRGNWYPMTGFTWHHFALGEEFIQNLVSVSDKIGGIQSSFQAIMLDHDLRCLQIFPAHHHRFNFRREFNIERLQKSDLKTRANECRKRIAINGVIIGLADPRLSTRIESRCWLCF